MKTTRRTTSRFLGFFSICGMWVVAGLVTLAMVGPALADGMIVPISPDIRVRGAWAVRYHHVDITVRDQVASVSIAQEFVNTGRGMIEVEYFFPVPPTAAIDSMTLIVNGKELAAKLLKADEARKIYEEIVRKKKDPALLEYAGFGLYRTRAFPLEPGKPAKVVVTYKYVCKKDRDLVEVWYPLNTEKFSAREIDDVRVRVDIKAAADIASVYSPTHVMKIDRTGPRRVVATYHEKKVLPTTDLQLFYKAANEEVAATFLTHRSDVDKDGYFMLLVSPSPRSTAGKIVPKNVVIVLDRSGSMGGAKIVQAKEAVTFILNNLNKDDRFNVISYSDGIETFFDGLADASAEKIEQAADLLDRVDARGGTNIHDALAKAMELFGKSSGSKTAASAASDRPSYVIFLTDGLATVGKTDEKTILTDTGKANASGARLFAFGVGYDVNVRLLDKLVRENHGRSDYVKPKEPIESKISSLYAKIKNPVMTDLKVSISGVRICDMYPRELGDLFEGDQIVLVGRYGEEQRLRAGRELATTLLITGRYEGKQRVFEYSVLLRSGGAKGYEFVEKLWAMRRVGWLLDQIQLNGESKEIVDELVQLSMKYGIITPYTSFLADENTNLADAHKLHEKAVRSFSSLRKVSGGAAQRGAMNRQKLNRAGTIAPSAAPGSDLKQIGHSRQDTYEAGEAETIANVRNVGNQTIYRRGRIWVTPATAKLDLKRDAAQIKTIDRFSEEYFRLVRANGIGENQVLAAQQPDEQLLITLGGQVYLIR